MTEKKGNEIPNFFRQLQTTNYGNNENLDQKTFLESAIFCKMDAKIHAKIIRKIKKSL